MKMKDWIGLIPDVWLKELEAEGKHEVRLKVLKIGTGDMLKYL